jgi:hypothetical protein
VGTLTRLTRYGHLRVNGRFYNAKTGEYLAYGGYPIYGQGLPVTLPVTSIVPLPKVPIRCTMTLSWDNPQPIDMS